MADTDYSQTIIGYYKNILGRVPGADEVAVWNNRLQSGATTLSGLAQTFATSPEAKEFSQPVAELYQSLLGRSPDQAGLEHWTSQYKSAVTGGEDSHAALASIAQQFFQSPETQALYGSDGSTAADVTASAVTKLYENALGREPGTLANGTTEVQYWVNKAQTENLSLQNIATQFALSPEATSGAQQARVVANLIAGATGIELTSGADSLQGTSSNDLFVAGTFQDGKNLVSTLGQNDTLTGNGGNDTLLVRGLMNESGVSNNLGAPTLNNIQNLDIQGSTGPATLDLLNAQGTTNVSLASDGGLTLNLNDAQNVQNLGVDSSKGANVTLDNAASLSNVTVSSSDNVQAELHNASKLSDLNVSNSNNAQINVESGASTLNVALSNTNSTAQTVTLHDGNVKNLAVSATGAENLNLNTAQAQSINVTGQSGSLELNGAASGAFTALTSVDASGFAGTSTFKVDALKADGASKLATLKAGSGTSDEVITSANNLASATNATGVNVSGFEELGALSGTYDLKGLNAAGNSISKVDVSQATNDVELDNAQSGLTVASTAADQHDLTVKNVYATTGNELNLQVGDNATAKTGASFGAVNLDAGTNSVNIVSDLDQAGNAGVDNGTLVYGNTISDLNASASGVGSIDVSGAGNLDVAKLEAGKSALTIDASQTTGQVKFDAITGSTKGDTFTAGSGDTTVAYTDNSADTNTTNTFTGGAGNDTFTISGSGKGTNIITGGAGNDTFTISDSDTNVLTGGSGVDTFDVTKATGATTFNYSSASDALVSVDAKGTETGIETITGFNTGSDKIDLSALGLNVSGGIGVVNASQSSDASVFTDIASGKASATELSSLKDLFTAGTDTTYLPPSNGGTSSPSGDFAATVVSLGNGNDLLFVNNAGSTGFDASQDSVISLSAANGSTPGADSHDWAQALVLSK